MYVSSQRWSWKDNSGSDNEMFERCVNGGPGLCPTGSREQVMARSDLRFENVPLWHAWGMGWRRWDGRQRWVQSSFNSSDKWKWQEGWMQESILSIKDGPWRSDEEEGRKELQESGWAWGQVLRGQEQGTWRTVRRSAKSFKPVCPFSTKITPGFFLFPMASHFPMNICEQGYIPFQRQHTYSLTLAKCHRDTYLYPVERGLYRGAHTGPQITETCTHGYTHTSVGDWEMQTHTHLHAHVSIPTWGHKYMLFWRGWDTFSTILWNLFIYLGDDPLLREEPHLVIETFLVIYSHKQILRRHLKVLPVCFPSCYMFTPHCRCTEVTENSAF